MTKIKRLIDCLTKCRELMKDLEKEKFLDAFELTQVFGEIQKTVQACQDFIIQKISGGKK